MDFYEKHAASRDRFEILAFHDSRAKDFAELDEKMKPIIENQWKGRSLPFPILLDATGKTLERWGIRSFPTLVVIDPEGNVVRGGTVEMVEKALGG
jgi:hypothetical protein